MIMSRVLCASILAVVGIVAVGCGEAQMGGSSYETGNALAGRVVDSNGIPQAGVEVRIRPYWHVGDGTAVEPDASEGIFDLETDGQGRFKASSIPVGEYRIEAKGCRSGAFAARFIGSSSGANLIGDLELGRLGVIVGRVSLPPGCPRAVVQVYGSDRAILTEVDGSFSLTGMSAGMTRVRAIRSDSLVVLGEAQTEVASDSTEDVGTLSGSSEDPATWRHALEVVVNTGSEGITTNEPVADLPVMLRLDSSLFPDGASSDGSDLRVVDASGRRVPMELSEWDPVALRARIWVRIDTIFPNDASRKIRVLWGRAGSVTASAPVAVWDTARGWSGVWHLSEIFRDSLGRVRTPDATAWKLDGILTGANREQVQEGVISSHRFDGASDLLRIGGASTEFGIRPFTLEMWILTGTKGVAILNKGASSRDQGMRQLYLGGATPSVQTLGWHPSLFLRPDTTRTQFGFHSLPMDSGRWTHLTVRMVPSKTNSLEIKVDWFLDGKWSDSATTLCKVADRPGDSLGVGGVLADGVGRPFGGWLGELRVSKVARSDAWIRLSEAAQTPGNRLVRYLPVW